MARSGSWSILATWRTERDIRHFVWGLAMLNLAWFSPVITEPCRLTRRTGGRHMKKFDLVAVGGGAGALAAVEPRWPGKTARSSAIVPIGGDCTWTGCVPVKTLIGQPRRASTLPRPWHEYTDDRRDRRDRRRRRARGEGITVIEGRAV